MGNLLVLLKIPIFVLIAIFGLANAVYAQPLAITSPSNGVRLASGPDYATDTFGDPWDMSNKEDISIDPDDRSGWATFDFYPNGTVGGTTVALPGGGIDTTLTFLNRGYHKIVNIGRTGQLFPIDTSVFKKISFKMSSGVPGELPAVYWFHRPPGDILGFGSIFTQTSVVGNKIYIADLTSTPAEGAPWITAPVVGLRIDPNGTQAGQEVFFDWVRLTRADNDALASKFPITWTGGNGHATIEILDASGTVYTVASDATSPVNWNYGILPPGNYVLRITSGAEIVSVSFQINSPPKVQMLDPDVVGGDDFAAVVLNNAWDMNSDQDADVVNGEGVSFFNGILSATNTTSDPMVILHNSNTPIDTSRYRYLSYRLKLDGPYDIANGSMARIFWSSTIDADAPRMTTSRDILVWPGSAPNSSEFVTYTVDLSQLTVENGGLEATGAQQEWRALGQVRHLRIDPHEFGSERRFSLDYVTLTAMREAKGVYEIRYSALDENPEDASIKVNLFYAPDKTPSSRQFIVSNLPLTLNGSFNWNLAGVPPGDYYIYAEVDDGLNKYGSYSLGLLRVLPVTLPGPPVITSSVVGNGRVIISFLPPQDNGGIPIIDYSATCSASGYPTKSKVGTNSPITVPNLVGGVTYSCSVRASNAIGVGSSSNIDTITSLREKNIVPAAMMFLLE